MVTYCDAAASIAPSADQCVGRSDNILVEETSRPDLTWDEGTTEDTYEEAQSNESLHVLYKTGQSSGYGAGQKHHDICPSRPKAVTHGTCNEAYEKGASKCSNVRVCDIDRR